MDSQTPVPGSKLMWVAHAGMAVNLPGRTPTLSTINHAVSLGVDMIELDICVTGDGVLIVTHDPVIENKKHLRKMTLSQVRQTVPTTLTLDECVKYVGGRTAIMLDLKISGSDLGAVKAVSDWLNLNGVATNAVVCSKDPVVLAELRGTAPHIDRWQTLPQVEGARWQILGQTLAVLWKHREAIGWDNFRQAFADAVRDLPSTRRLKIGSVIKLPWKMLPTEVPALVSAVGASGLTVMHRLVTPDLVEAANELNIPIIAWVVNDPNEVPRVIECGVAGITSDRVQEVRDAAVKHGLVPPPGSPGSPAAPADGELEAA